MNLMVLDAEYNQPSRKCIQIGAAVFNAKTGQEVDRIEFYVNPGEPISSEIVTLTGITDRDVSNGLTIAQAYEELKFFHKKNKCFRNPMVWGSGVSNDSSVIYREMRASLGLPPDTDIVTEENFMGFRVIDVKTIYQSVQIFGESQYAGGLVDSMRKLGMEFEGESHRALNDAINTFRVWHHLMRIFQDGKKKR